VAISRRSGRSRFTLILLLLTSVTLLTLDIRGFGPLESARDSTLSALGPVKDFVADTTAPVSDAWNGAFRYGDLEAENERLQDRIRELEGTQVDAERDIALLRNILGELNIPYVTDIEARVALVVSGPVSNFEDTIEINKGSGDGVEVGMPVVSHAGLVGRIDRVTANRSRVVLITDPDFNVGVKLTRSGDVGVARGQGSNRPLIVDQGIESDVVVQDNELVTTSGLGRSLFPADVPVGTVRSSQVLRGELDQELLIDPLANLGELSVVNILMWTPPE
jgi:rod shape-determining protein MreC